MSCTSVLALLLAAPGCNEERSAGDDGLGHGTAGGLEAGLSADDSGDGGGTADGEGEEGSQGDEGAGGVRLDVEDPELPPGTCAPLPGDGPIGTCETTAPPDAFEPRLEWSWTGLDGEISAIVTPLVANLTDDNGDGVVDTCDVPDIVVVAGSSLYAKEGFIHILSGDDGRVIRRFDQPVNMTVTPALGDIDGDGEIEIVAQTHRDAGPGGLPQPDRTVAFEVDGSVLWLGGRDLGGAGGGSLAIADLDNDGDVEVYNTTVYDHLGEPTLLGSNGNSSGFANTAADLDGDGDLEIIASRAAFHHDGLPYYELPELPRLAIPQVANLDDDDEPEILLASTAGLIVLEHDAKVKFGPITPTGQAAVEDNVWLRPAVVHDFDGDGAPEFGIASGSVFATYERDGTLRWDAPVTDFGNSASTAFDFLGDGSADTMYADELTLFVFDDTGRIQLEEQRTSGTLAEYPVVADVDNDGSAEVIVISNDDSPSYMGDTPSPTVQVFGDAQDRWIQARRIWNQHTYHVTNVDENGGIPQFEQPSWLDLNTFRSQAQIEAGRVCRPSPAG